MLEQPANIIKLWHQRRVVARSTAGSIVIGIDDQIFVNMSESAKNRINTIIQQLSYIDLRKRFTVVDLSIKSKLISIK